MDNEISFSSFFTSDNTYSKSQVHILNEEEILNCRASSNLFHYQKDASSYEDFIVRSMKKLKHIEYIFELDIYKEKLHNLNKKHEYFSSVNQPIVVFDLDETLIHTETICDKTKYDFIIENFGIAGWVRPGIYDLIQLFKSLGYCIVLYSAGNAMYVELIISIINLKNVIDFILVREDCICLDIKGENIFIKDIRIFNNEECILIDNSFMSFGKNLANAVLVTSYYGDKSDCELFDIYKFIKENANVSLKQLFNDYFQFDQIFKII